MKQVVPVLLGVLVGASIASLAWAIYVVRFQVQLAAANTELHAMQGEMGEIILRYLDGPDAARERQLSFAASNWVRTYISISDTWDEHYPWLGVGERYRTMHAANILRFEQFMRERAARPNTN